MDATRERQYIRFIQKSWGNALKLYPDDVLRETKHGKTVPLAKKVEIVSLFLAPPTTQEGWAALTQVHIHLLDEFGGPEAVAKFRRLIRKALGGTKTR